MNFGQLMTAMITPFTNDGKLDITGTMNLIDHLYETGTDTLVINGTTAEVPTLTNEEKRSMLQTAIQHASGKMKVIAGVGSNNTALSVELAQEAYQLGADGIMVVAPYYNKPSQEGLYQHMMQVADATPLPVMLYNVPGRTGVDMSIETTLRFATHSNVFAIKEASADVDKISALIHQAPADFLVYSGDDSLTLPILAVGGAGVVSVASHIVGSEMKQMIAAFESGQIKQAAAQHSKLFPVMQAMFMAPSPAPVKAALEAYGLPSGAVRLPLLALTDVEKSVLQPIIAPFVPQTT
ncbi:dihydrodipicolinate synthase [Bacillus sp. JCM 19045]|nr:dihydrodipicolinate synthase [Bacillus sp. JCM 19045]